MKRILVSLVVSLILIAPLVSVMAHGYENEESTNIRQSRLESRVEQSETFRAQRHENVCEHRQKAVNLRNGRIKAVMQKHLDFMDTIFERVQTFVNSKELEVEDYEDLIDAVRMAQAEARTAVDEFVDNRPPTLDCEDETVIDDIRPMRNSVAQTVKALKSYRQALQELLQAVKTAAEAGNVGQEGGNQ